ncbi:DNA glycosylase [Trichophaea hybrida]|nr:DNA glycosylase [Trichophaea hybrida]
MVRYLRPRVLSKTFTASKPRGRSGIGSTTTTAAAIIPGDFASEKKAAPLTSGSVVNGNKREIVDDSAGLAPIENPLLESQAGPPETTTVAKEEKGGSSPDDPANLEDTTPNVEALIASTAGNTAPEPPRKKARRSKAAFGKSPWPEHPHPTLEECAEVNRLLTAAHGPSTRPEKLVVNNSVSGCGEVPCVLDALLRTILSLNTTTLNSGRAFQGLIARFGLIPTKEEEQKNGQNPKKRKYTGSGAGSVDWDAVRRGPVEDLEESIKVGGLQAKKAKTIKDILDQVWKEGQERIKAKRHEEALKRVASRRASPESYDTESELSELSDDEDGELTLDHLHELDNIPLLKKLTSFSGIGYKAASCVMLFSLGREIFPVDTHVHRLTRFLGWVPDNATEVTGFFHLDVKIPDKYKYPLHNLLIRHGRMCKHCKGGPETKPKDPNAKPKIKNEPEPELDKDGNPIKVKRTKKVWVGNGLMKEIVVEVDTDDEAAGLDDDSCVLEDLVKRIRKARRAPLKPKKEAQESDDMEDTDAKPVRLLIRPGEK